MKALEVYQPPFSSDGCFIWSSNEVMALMLADYYANEEDVLDKLAEILNDHDKPAQAHQYEYDAPEILQDGKPLLVVRGWGHLTEAGALHLDPDEAGEIQDEFARWVISKLVSK